jgi:hypothetical protein
VKGGYHCSAEAPLPLLEFVCWTASHRLPHIDCLTSTASHRLPHIDCLFSVGLPRPRATLLFIEFCRLVV